MDNNVLVEQRNLLRGLAEAYVNGDEKAFRGLLAACYKAEFQHSFFEEIFSRIEDCHYHMPRVPKKKDGSPDMGTDAYRIYTMMDCELYAIYRILQHDVSPQILQQAYDMVYPHFFSSRWKMDQILDRFFADREKT